MTNKPNEGQKVTGGEYPYALGERIIAEQFPHENKYGSIIEYTDCGTLHSMLAKFYTAIQPKPDDRYNTGIKQVNTIPVPPKPVQDDWEDR